MPDYARFIGREQVLSETISPEICTRLAVTLGRPVPTQAEVQAGAPAPLETFLLICLPAPDESDLGIDGLPIKDDFLPPIDLPRRVWGGSRLTIGDGFRVGQNVVRRGQISDIYEKNGRSGRMVFVEVDYRFEADGRLCLREELRLVYLAERAGQDVAPPAPQLDEITANEFRFTPHQMFRFAAITFNAHRIHFDTDYARRQEGYQDMVVQGPLMTIAILSDLQNTIEAPLAHIELRGHGIAYVNEPLHIEAPSPLERNLCNRSGDVLVSARAEL